MRFPLSMVQPRSALALAAPFLAAGVALTSAADAGQDAGGSKPKTAVIAFGLYGDQSVFESEATRAAKLVAERFASSSTIVRSNTATRDDANADTLTATLESVGGTLTGGNDVLFLIMTSHGSQAGLDVKAGARDQLLSPLDLVAALDHSKVKYRVVIISACYSGVFIRPLADPNTLVITAADADHASFGCRNGNEWTYFGDALFNTAMRRTGDLRDAFAQASAVVRKREHQKHLAPSNPQIAGGENVERILKGEPDKVVAYSIDGSGLDPRYAFSRGIASGLRGDYANAITAYSEAIAFDPRFPIAYNNRGVSYFKTGDNDRAIADYTKSLQINPGVPGAYANRARAFREKGDLRSALADYDKVIKLDPKSASAYDSRGQVYSAKGDHDRAIADYTKAVKLDPKLADAFEKRGHAYSAKGDTDRASRDFEEAIRLDPKLADTLKPPAGAKKP